MECVVFAGHSCTYALTGVSYRYRLTTGQDFTNERIAAATNRKKIIRMSEFQRNSLHQTIAVTWLILFTYNYFYLDDNLVIIWLLHNGDQFRGHLPIVSDELQVVWICGANFCSVIELKTRVLLPEVDTCPYRCDTAHRYNSQAARLSHMSTVHEADCTLAHRFYNLHACDYAHTPLSGYPKHLSVNRKPKYSCSVLGDVPHSTQLKVLYSHLHS